MDPLMLGELLALEAGDGGTHAFEGFWMPAGGNDGVGAFQVFYASTPDVFTVKMQTKSSDQDDSSAADIGSQNINSSGPAKWRFPVTNARDLVRYVVEGAMDGSTRYIHLQFANPTWIPH